LSRLPSQDGGGTPVQNSDLPVLFPPRYFGNFRIVRERQRSQNHIAEIATLIDTTRELSIPLRDVEERRQANNSGMKMTDHKGRIVIPLHVERAFAEKRRRVTGRVAVSRVSRRHEQLVEEMLASESLTIERVPRGQPVDRVPPVREEGDTIIVPVVEEVLAVERRLILKEEVRVKRVRTLNHFRESVQLRKQELVVTRMPVSEETVVPGARPNATNPNSGSRNEE